MHLCFVDESGSPPSAKRAADRRYFVMAGVIMHENQWHAVSQEVRQLKARREYDIRGEISGGTLVPTTTMKTTQLPIWAKSCVIDSGTSYFRYSRAEKA